MIMIDEWFPTVIGVADCPFINEIRPEYDEYLKTFEYDDSGFSFNNIHKDKRFNKLTEWIIEMVAEYAKLHNYPDEYVPYESWTIDYKINEGQPYHAHNGWTISANFIYKSDINDVPTMFKSPYFIDPKNPIRITAGEEGKLELNKYTYQTTSYKPIEGRLMIFRSQVEHSTGSNRKTLNTKRVIMAYNFDPKENDYERT